MFQSTLFGTVSLEQLAFSSVVVGAAIDSINPCAFGVLIFLMTYLLQVFDDANMMLLGGLLYTLTVFITYFLAGVGLLQVVQSPTVSYWFYWIATFVAFGAAAFELKDYVWYGKGVSMEMLGGSTIKRMAEGLEETATEHPWTALSLTVPIGFAAAAFELPCTGQVYLAILSLIDAAAVTTWVPWLVLYNVIFVAPLLVITALLYWGTASDRLERWRKRNRRYMRLAAGLFLYIVGAVLLWFTHRQFPTQSSLEVMTFLLVASQVAIFTYITLRVNE